MQQSTFTVFLENLKSALIAIFIAKKFKDKNFPDASDPFRFMVI